MPLHASCAARSGDGVLIMGPSGAGKSDLVLRLMGRGWDLVADDQVEVTADALGLQAAPPGPLAGMLEVRGLGLMQNLPYAAPARLRLVVALLPDAARPPRLPEAARFEALGHSLPRIALQGHEASAPDKVALALDVVSGRAALAAGALDAPDAAPRRDL
jgi:HPr kinase/phosphorylase